jgi:ABC-type Fe3+/spermidine/putrescine transport system ATPase subunit
MAMADKISLMQGGELLQVGTSTELYHHPARPEVADFFGLVNWVEGKMVQPALAETPIGPLEVTGSVALGSEVRLGFRPESISALSTPPAGGKNVLSGVLRASTFLGDQFLYDVTVGDHLFVGKGRMVPAHGDGRLCLYVDPADIMVFPVEQKAIPRGAEAGTSPASG